MYIPIHLLPDFDFGIDVVFEFGYLSKISIHTNVIPHFLFGIYERCDFTIDISNLKTIGIGKVMKTWKDVQSILGPPSSQPVISNPGDQPFESTEWYEYSSQCIGVEVLENGSVATVVIWKCQ